MQKLKKETTDTIIKDKRNLRKNEYKTKKLNTEYLDIRNTFSLERENKTIKDMMLRNINWHHK